MDELIWIKTTRYSELFKRLLNRYPGDLLISIDGKEYTERNLEELLANWCSNKSIRATRNFLLKHQGREIAGFHDGPEETWFNIGEADFVGELRDSQVIRIRVFPRKIHKLSSLRAALYLNCAGVVVLPAILFIAFRMAPVFDFKAYALYSIVSIVGLNLVCIPIIALMNSARRSPISKMIKLEIVFVETSLVFY